MTFRGQPAHNGCNCKSGNQNSFAKRVSPYSHSKPIQIEQDSVHNYVQIEEILMQERNKFKEQRERFEVQLDSQRKIRLNLENKLVKLKEEFSKKQVLISDLEFKQNGCLNQNQSLAIENERLRNELMLLQDISRAKLLQLQTKLTNETRNGEQAAARYDMEFQKFKKQGLQYIENLTQQYEKKIKILDERAKTAEGAKRGLMAEISRLNDVSLSNQLNFDTQLRETTNRLRDQQSRKTQQLSKSFQQRFKAMQQNKQSLGRKVQEIAKNLQQKQKAYDDLLNDKFEEAHRLNQQLSNAHNQKQQIASAYEKVKIDLNERTKAPSNGYTEQVSSSDAAYLKQQLSNKNKQLDGFKDIIRQLRQNVKQVEYNSGRDKQQWIDKANLFQNQTRKYRELYQKLCEKLKLKITETINTACYTRQ